MFPKKRERAKERRRERRRQKKRKSNYSASIIINSQLVPRGIIRSRDTVGKGENKQGERKGKKTAVSLKN